jgi:hypothetical protein
MSPDARPDGLAMLGLGLQHNHVMTLLAGDDPLARQTVRVHGEMVLRGQVATGTPEPVHMVFPCLI